MIADLAYADYWRRKELLAGPVPRFPVRGWWKTDGLCDIEREYLSAVEGADSLLDFGAGDLRIQRKLQAAGYGGTYHTLDISPEYEHTYADLDQVSRTYQAVLCLDVIEHMPLNDGLALLGRLTDLLEPGGVLVVQTPNARCIRQPLSWDMTHQQCYNLPDLWAYLTCLGYTVAGFRVVFRPQRRSLAHLVRHTVAAYAVTRLLGCDYADNIALVARKTAGVPRS